MSLVCSRFGYWSAFGKKKTIKKRKSCVMYYMATGQIWNGGQMPVLGDPLYLSIVDELAEQEYVIEETWETVVPTNLIALQSSGVAVDAEGLPCGTDCADHAGTALINNGHVIIGG